jgi:hypothetical protein
MRWVNEIPQVISDREHALEEQELMDLRPQMRLQLRSLKRQALPVRTQPRPATTVAVRLMSLGVGPNTSEGILPPTYRGQRKTGAHAFATVWSARADIPFGESFGLRQGHSTNIRRRVAGPLGAPHCTMFFPGCYNRSALASGYLVILSSV